jgi:hypothetical protein
MSFESLMTHKGQSYFIQCGVSCLLFVVSLSITMNAVGAHWDLAGDDVEKELLAIDWAVGIKLPYLPVFLRKAAHHHLRFEVGAWTPKRT